MLERTLGAEGRTLGVEGHTLGVEGHTLGVEGHTLVAEVDMSAIGEGMPVVVVVVH